MLLLDRLRRKRPVTSDAPTALIVGLGNPGREHAGNRHNVGWQVADYFAGEHGWRFAKRQFDALVALGHIGDTRVVVAKPQTFMNLSGRAVQPLMRFYKVPADRLLVVYDEIDLPFGTVRLREKGGAGGHNGMRSIMERLGGGDFARLRIGVNRPPGRMEAAAHVLRDFDASERAELPTLFEHAARAIETFVGEGIARAMNKHNGSIRSNPP